MGLSSFFVDLKSRESRTDEQENKLNENRNQIVIYCGGIFKSFIKLVIYSILYIKVIHLYAVHKKMKVDYAPNFALF